jgi:hypothetical protein
MFWGSERTLSRGWIGILGLGSWAGLSQVALALSC